MQCDPSPGRRVACNSPSEGTRFRQSCQSRSEHPAVSDDNKSSCGCDRGRETRSSLRLNCC